MVTMQADPSCCGMSVLQHMDIWRLTSQSLHRDARDVMILLALGLVALISVWRPPLSLKHLDQDFITYQLYLKRNPDLLSFNHLKLTFARARFSLLKG